MENVSNVRNLAVAGHSGSGKTALCDLMLYKAGAVERQGRTEQKTSISDYTVDEQEKQSSIYATSLHCSWKDNQFFIVDTPGYGEFIGETTAAVSACDNTLVVVHAANGIEVGCTRAMKISRKMGKPRFVLVNHMDNDAADFDKVVKQLQDAYGKTVCIPVTVPSGQGASLKSIIHVLRDTDIPGDISESVEKYKEQLMDAIAESDEELMMRYLEGEELSEEEISSGLHKAIAEGSLMPVFAGSAEKDMGIDLLMNAVVNLMLPTGYSGKIKLADGKDADTGKDAAPMALVFKSVIDPYIGQLTFFKVESGVFKSDSEAYNVTRKSKERFGSLMLMNGKEQVPASEVTPGCIAAMAKLKNTRISDTLAVSPSCSEELPKIEFPEPVMSYAVTAAKNGEEEKIASGLLRLAESDPTVTFKRHDETHEMLLSGMGDQHLHNIVKKLKETSKVDVNLDTPKIPYRETVTSKGQAQYRHKKQTGGHGQFAEVHMRMEPNPEGYEFCNEVVGGNIPKNFIPAVEKGVLEAMARGPLAGCVVENLKVTVYDGKYHPVDSSEMAFKIASRAAFRKAMELAKPVLLEPLMIVKIMIPDDCMGDISGDLNHKRGRIQGMGIEEGLQVVNAEVPLAEMSKYATELRSMTQGRGVFEMEFARYENVPANVAKEIIDNFKAEEEEN